MWAAYGTLLKADAVKPHRCGSFRPHGPVLLRSHVHQPCLGAAMAQEVRAVVWQSEGRRFDPTLGVSRCP